MRAGHLGLAGTAAFVAILTLAYYIKSLTPVLFGVPEGEDASHGNKPLLPAMTVPALCLAFLCLGSVVFIFPGAANIVLSRDNDGTKVSFDAKPAVQPRVSDLDGGTVLVSRIEPTNKYARGFTKGERNETKLLIFDSAGKVQAPFNVECTAAAF